MGNLLTSQLPLYDEKSFLGGFLYFIDVQILHIRSQDPKYIWMQNVRTLALVSESYL